MWTLGHHGKYFAPITVLLVSPINEDLSRLGAKCKLVLSDHVESLLFATVTIFTTRTPNNGLHLETSVRTHFILFANFLVHYILCFQSTGKLLLHIDTSYSTFSWLKYYFPRVMCTTAQFTHRNITTRRTKAMTLK